MPAPNEPIYQPAGYCPKCGYAMDPGLCPECGIDVSQRSLLAVHPQILFRRYVRWSAALVILAVLALVGYRIYFHMAWETWLPDGVIVSWANHGSDRIDIEAIQRLEAGQLSQADRDRLFESALYWDTLHATSIPQNTTMPLYVAMHRNHGIFGWNPKRQIRYDIGFDNWQVNLYGDDLTLENLPYEKGAFTLILELPPLPPGQYTIECAGDHAVYAFNSDQPAFAKHSQLTSQIIVVDAGIEDYVQLVTDPITTDDQQQRFSVKPCEGHSGNPQEVGFEMQFQRLPMGFAFDIYTRPSNSNQPYTRYNLLFPLFGRSLGGELSFHVPATLPPQFATAQAIDVQLRPALETAATFNLDRIYGNVVEWLDVPLEYETDDQPQIKSIAPTRIFPYNPNQFSESESN